MNSVLVVTGTSKGIGKAIAENYLFQGNVVVGCSRGTSSIEHQCYYHYELDISDEKAVVEMVKSVKKQFGKIDILINNAGIASMNHFVTTPYRSLQSIFSVNVFGSFLFSREVSKIMIKQKYGSIVNFTSVAAPLSLAGESAYAMSKASIECFTKIAAKELGEFGIRVNAIGPTPVKTDLIKTVPPQKIKELLNQQIFPRFGEVRDILNVIDFFIDEKSDFITGQIIYLGGILE